MSKTTEQAEGGGSKVARKAIFVVSEFVDGRVANRWVCNPELAERRRAEFGDVEPYIPVSALFSDEGLIRRFVEADGEEDSWLEAARELQEVLAAAIDHLGGTDAH